MKIMVQQKEVDLLVGFHLDRQIILCHCVVDGVFYGMGQFCLVFYGDLTIFQRVSWRHGLLGQKDCVVAEGFLARDYFQHSEGM